MRVVGLSLRDFRGYHDASVQLGEGLTVITGPNGAGKTNLLEALYFGCTGRSCRTTNEREVVRFGERATRVVVAAEAEDGPHELSVGFAPGEPKRMRVDGANVERLVEVSERPLVSVFLPDRLELIKGAPSLRRAHLDQLVAAPVAGACRHPPDLSPVPGPAQRPHRAHPLRRGQPQLIAQLGRAVGAPRPGPDGRPPGCG